MHQIDYQNNPVLTDIFRSYYPSDSVYIADEIFKGVKVSSRTATAPTIGKEYLRLIDDIVVGRTEAPIVEYDISHTNMWSCEAHELKFIILRKDGELMMPTNWKKGMEMAKERFSRFLKTQRLVGREYAVAATLQNPAIITHYTRIAAGAGRFNSPTAPIKDYIATARTNVRTSTGYLPNTAMMSFAVREILKDHPQLKAKIYGGGPVPITSLSDAQIAQALEVKRIKVGEAQYNSAKKGQTATMVDIWGKNLIFAYISENPNPSEYEMSLGFRYYLDDEMIDEWPLNEPKYAQVIRAHSDYDLLLQEAGAAYLFLDVID